MDPQQEKEFAQQSAPGNAAGTMLVVEAQLRHIARTEHSFNIFVLPLIENESVWWCLRLRLPDNPRELRVVDAHLAERRWRQLNALVRFIIRCCGRDRRVTIDLYNLSADMIRTRGEGRGASGGGA